MCFTSMHDQHCNTANRKFNVEYVLQEACRPKLDKTGITLIDEIIIARALSLSRSLHDIFPLKCVQFLIKTPQIQHSDHRPFSNRF